MRKWFALFMVVLFAVGCGKHPRYDSPVAVPLIYDDSVDSDHRDWMDLDMKTLSWVKPTDLEEKTIFHLSEMTSESLTGWLKARARYIVGEYFDLGSKINNNKENYAYTPDVFAAVTLMTNLGSGLYRYGKQNKTAISVRVGNETPLVNSPRIGIYRLGPGHFSDQVVGQKGDVESVKNSITRLATVFHEARHGDGNGDSLGFAHSICASGAFKGNYACDDSTNGPYTIGKLILKSFRASCDECDEGEMAELDASIVDNASRVLPGAKEKDDRAERISP